MIATERFPPGRSVVFRYYRKLRQLARSLSLRLPSTVPLARHNSNGVAVKDKRHKAMVWSQRRSHSHHTDNHSQSARCHTQRSKSTSISLSA